VTLTSPSTMIVYVAAPLEPVAVIAPPCTTAFPRIVIGARWAVLFDIRNWLLPELRTVTSPPMVLPLQAAFRPADCPGQFQVKL